jgi:glycosyltransferase involved in cell wall biosynthesis
VIIPAFNAGRYVGAAVTSVLTQDYPNKEVIVVDDGSTDDTLTILQAFGPSIEVIVQSNMGAASARNAGLKAARGVYIAFLDADDRWFPRKLSSQVGYLEANPRVGMVYNRWMVWDEDGHEPATGASQESILNEEGRIVTGDSGWLYHRLLFDSIVHTSSVVIRKAVVDDVGLFDESLRNGQDYDYWLRVSRICEIHKLATTLSVYRLHPHNNTKIPKRTNYEYVVVRNALRRWGNRGPDGSVADPREISRRLARMCFAFGYVHLRHGDPRLSRVAFRDALTHRAVWPKAWLYWLLAGAESLGILGGALRRKR